MDWLLHVLIQLIILIAVVGIINVLVPWIVGKLGPDGGVIAAVVRIVLWAIVAIFVLVICFELIQCLLGYAGGFTLLPKR